MTSPYRAPASPPERSSRFVRVLVGSLGLRVRLERDRVVVDAVDVVAMFTIGMCAMGVLPILFAKSWLGAVTVLAALIATMFSARVHLRVRPGRAVLVRTVLLVPWWITSRDARAAEVGWADFGFDDTELCMPPRPPCSDPETRTFLLSTMFHGLRDEEIEEVDSEIRRVLGGE